MTLFSVDSIFSVLYKCTYVLGIEPFKRKTDQPVNMRSKLLAHAKNFYFVMVYATISSYILSAGIFFVLNFGNLLDISKSLTYLASGPCIMYRLWVTCHNKETIMDMIATLKRTFPQTQDEQNRYGIAEQMKLFQFFTKMYIFGIFVTFMLFNAAPIINYFFIGYPLLSSDFWIPFNPYDPLLYPFVYLWQLFGAGLTMIAAVASEIVTFIFIKIISLEFNILKQDIENFRAKDDREMLKNLKSFMIRHNSLLELCGKIEEIYSKAYLGSYIASMILFCVMGLQLSTSNDFVSILKNGGYLFTAKVTSMMLHIFGQMMIDSSELIPNAFYSCNWYEIKNSRCKRIVSLLILRSQKCAKITALNFADISLESYASVSQNIYFR